MSTIRAVTGSVSGESPVECALALRFDNNPKPALLACVLLIVSTLAVTGCGSSHAEIKLPDPEVLVMPPVQQDVAVHSEWVATLDGYVNAEIRPQVAGYITSQNYKEGGAVRKGQVLFEIDPRPFQASLNGAKGELARANAELVRARGERARALGELGQAEAQLSKSTMDVERDTPLVAQKAVAKEKLDTELQVKRAAQAAVASAQAAVQSAEAAIVSAQAAIEANKAAVERAELNLGWTKVTSLIDGLAGVANVQMGNPAQDAARLSDVRYRGGAASYLEVLTNETNAFNAELGLAGAQLSELLNLVEIYRTLGGGWES